MILLQVTGLAPNRFEQSLTITLPDKHDNVCVMTWQESAHNSAVGKSLPKWRVTRARGNIAKDEASLLEPKQELVDVKHEVF